MSTHSQARKDMLPTPAVIWALIRFQPWPFLAHSLLTVLVFSLQVVPGLIVKTVFDTISGVVPAQQAGVVGASPLVWWVLLYVGTELVNLIAGFGADWFGWTFRLVVGALLRSNIFASILRRKADQPLSVAPGEIIYRLSSDVDEISDFPTWLPDQLGKWVAAGIAVVIMARINLSITLVIFLPLIGTMLLTRLAWGKMLVYRRAASEAGDKVAGFMGEVFGAVQSVKVADAEQAMADHIQVLSDRRARMDLRYELSRGLLEAINASVVSFGIGVVLLMAGQAISDGSFTVGDFALFVSYLWFTTQVPSEIGTFYGDYKTQEISIDRLLEMIRPEPANRLVGRHVEFDSVCQPVSVISDQAGKNRFEHLEVHDLTYRHNGTQPLPEGRLGDASREVTPGSGVRQISFTLEREEFLVITGRVGSGKSTLLRVLLGLLPHQSGEVRWNGRIVNDLDRVMRPPRAAFTSQSPRLFSETLRENLLLGLPDDPARIQRALSQSVLEEDVAILPLGLDTLIGPRGIRLSGGQAQRAAAARMYIRQPELLIFDDLSSALDVQTEQLLWDRLDSLRQSQQGVTCLVVSHRKPALTRADRIIVLKDGQVDAIGKLDELLKTNPEIQYLWNGTYE